MTLEDGLNWAADHSEYGAEAQEAPSDLRIEIRGEIDPRQLSAEEFDQSANLFHAARRQEFSVQKDFDYDSDLIDGATLGDGLYLTTSESQANNYAQLHNGTTFKLMPYQARLLNLTDPENPTKNLTAPQSIVNKWLEFAEPRLREQIANFQAASPGQWLWKEILQKYYDEKLLDLSTLDAPDLRRDVLGTGDRPFSPVSALWQEFLATQEIDGIIFAEHGEGKLSDQIDQTVVFYNLSRVGTYSDWQTSDSSQATGVAISPEEP